MKKAKSQVGFLMEQVSVTVSQVNQDASGKQTSNRTYWSTRKSIRQTNENRSALILEASKMPERGVRSSRRAGQKQIKKVTQLSLFPLSE